jgi:hypothetical protein
MKTSHLLSFLCGALVVLGVGMIGQSKAESSSHVYELRIYHPNPGKLPALEARFGKDTDRIFKKHNINALGYWIPNDNPNNLSSISCSTRTKPRPPKTGPRSRPIPSG